MGNDVSFSDIKELAKGFAILTAVMALKSIPNHKKAM